MHKSEFFLTDIELKVEFQFFLLHLALAATGRYTDHDIFGNIWHEKVKNEKSFYVDFSEPYYKHVYQILQKSPTKNFLADYGLKSERNNLYKDIIILK